MVLLFVVVVVVVLGTNGVVISTSLVAHDTTAKSHVNCTGGYVQIIRLVQPPGRF